MPVLAGELSAGGRGLLGLVTREALVSVVLGLSKLFAGRRLGPLGVELLALTGLSLTSSDSIPMSPDQHVGAVNLPGF